MQIAKHYCKIYMIGLVMSSISFNSFAKGSQFGPSGPLQVWIDNDGVKISPTEPIKQTTSIWSKTTNVVKLCGAKNEYVSFQIVLNSAQDMQAVDIDLSDLFSAGGVIRSENIELFREWYIKIKNPEPRPGSTGDGEYADPLIPFRNPYDLDHGDVGAPFSLKANRNQPIWVDIYIPKHVPAGLYRGTGIVSANSKEIMFTVQIKVWDVVLPNATHLQAFADLYSGRWTRGEGKPFRLDDDCWEMLKEYEIMAHEHRFVNGHWSLNPEIEVDDSGHLTAIDWEAYDQYLGQVLDGSLFENGEPPSTWELPMQERWGTYIGSRVFAWLSPEHFQAIKKYSNAIANHFRQKGWDLSKCFIYTIDEPGYERSYFTPDAVIEFGRAVNEGVGDDLGFMVTASLIKFPELIGSVDHWSVHGSHYYPPMFKERQTKGETTWFYQSNAEPWLPLHTIDTYGLALRIWAWIAWKYRVDGMFIWASNFWSERPYSKPSGYDRIGGGVLFYPGRKLPQIGLPAILGPVSSIRMKSWRRGIQDYEYLKLFNNAGGDADTLVNGIVNSALAQYFDEDAGYEEGSLPGWWEDPRYLRWKNGESQYIGEWSHTPNDYENVRKYIGNFLSRSVTVASKRSVVISNTHSQAGNPTFCTSTSIDFTLEEDRLVSVEIFNIDGEQVALMDKGIAEKGTHLITWDGCDIFGEKMTSGIYFYLLHIENESYKGKLVLIKG